MITSFPNRGAVLAATTFVLASLALTLFVWRSVGGSTPLQPQGYRIAVLFDEAGHLARNADVRVSGVSVGHVVSVRPRELRTEAVLELDSSFAPLRADSRATLRTKTLLGETFVALTPGSRASPTLREGATLPAGQVEPTQPLDRILGMLDAPTRRRLRALLTDTAAYVEGRGPSGNAALGNLADGTAQLEAMVRVLDAERPAVRALVRDGGAVLRTLGAEETGIDRLVIATRRAFAVTADHDRALTAAVRAAPPALRELRRTAGALERTAVAGHPAVRALRPVAPRLTRTLRATSETAPQLRRVLRELVGLTPTAREALPAIGRASEAFVPVTRALEPVAADVAPVLSYLGTYDRELVATMANISASTNATSADTRGRQLPYLRTSTLLGSETAVGWADRRGSNRHNAYRAPGGLAELAEGLTSSNCAHATPSDSAPPCRLQDPWSFAGKAASYFQRVGPSEAGGVAGAVRRLLTGR